MKNKELGVAATPPGLPGFAPETAQQAQPVRGLVPNAVRQLVRIRHGSHLYGTSTPASDLDYKGVHLPSGRAIILQRAEDVIDRRVKLSDGIKNNAGDVDEQSYSLQKFFGMLAAGDTNAAEILFAPPSAVLFADPAWPGVQAVGRSIINRKCSGFVGYCRRQAAKYGIKGSRMAAVQDLLALLAEHYSLAKLETLEPQLRAFAEREEHAGWVNIPSPNGSDLWHIDCCDRKMPMTASIKDAHDVYRKVWDNYGARARAAMNNEGVDWKAVSHAVRVARQAIELLTTGAITFPRPDAAELLAIKLGERAYTNVSPMLEALVAEVEAVALTSSLPERTDQRIIDAAVEKFYVGQIASAQGIETRSAETAQPVPSEG